MPPLRSYSLIAGALAATLVAPLRSRGQSSFDAPPVPSNGQQAPAVRGLYDPAQAPAVPAGPIGLEAAPAATFVAPATRDAVEQAAAAPTAPPGVPPQAKPIQGSEIVARVDDQVILASDAMWQVDQIVAANRDKIPEEQLEELRTMLLRQQVMGFIETKLLFADFRRTVPAENMTKISETIAEPFEKSEVPRLIKMLKVNDRAELETLLNKSGASIKDIQRQFTEKTIAGEWLRQRTPKPKPVTHEEMLAYYHDHLQEYEFPAQARWEELMVRFDRCDGDRDAAWRTLAEMANEVWQHAAAHPGLRGPVFAAVAKEKSHGFTAADGGGHDWTTLGALKCEEMNEALANLALGQMSDDIESELGFHIVRVLERKTAGRVPFTEAQVKIRASLEEEQKAVLFAAELAEIRKSARVWTIFDGDISGDRLAEVLDQRQRR